MPTGTRFVIVFVVDGLRPDAISPDGTPTLHRLRSEGVDFTNGHSVFPTVTRVNAAALGTGMHPGSNGILGNQMYVAAVDRAGRWTPATIGDCSPSTTRQTDDSC